MFFKRQPREIDFLLFGLGNPGPRYSGTRHNVGWWLLDLLLEKHPGSRHFSRHRSVADMVEIRGRQVALIRPTTFMNLSGESVRAWRREYPETPLAIAYDDTALDVGKVRVREKGSAGGHNGMKSIIECLGSDEVLRVRIGVGSPGDEDISDYVLAEPPEADRAPIHDSLLLAVRCCEELIDGSIGRAQHAASGQELPERKPRRPRREQGTPKLTMADLIAGRLKGRDANDRDGNGSSEEQQDDGAGS